MNFVKAPITEQAKELGLTKEILENCQVVYVKDENSGGYVFHSLYQSGIKCEQEHMVLPVGSTYNGLSEEYPAGTCFANAKETTYDPKYRDPGAAFDVSWIELLRRAYRGTGYSVECCCAERDIIYRAGSNDDKIPGFICTNGGVPRYDKDKSKRIYLHGAHVFMGVKENFEPADDGSVYLLPLCAAHNICTLVSTTYGQGYYMKLGVPMKAVMLKGFMKKPEGELPF